MKITKIILAGIFALTLAACSNNQQDDLDIEMHFTTAAEQTQAKTETDSADDTAEFPPETQADNAPARSAKVEIFGNKYDTDKDAFSVSHKDFSGVDFAPLIEQFTNLKSITLNGCENFRIDMIKNMTGLESLELPYTSISDLSGIDVLSNLKVLDINSTEVTTLTEVAKLSKLENLNIYDTKIHDLSPLSGMTSLKELNISRVCYNELIDISPIYNLSGLETLNLDTCSISDVDFLKNMSGMTSLKSLNLSSVRCGGTNSVDNGLKNLSGIENLTNLEELTITGYTEDIGLLGSLTKMKNLYMTSTKLDNIEPLKCMTQMEELTIKCDNVSDISMLSGMTGMKKLEIQAKNVGSIDALKGMTQMEELNMSFCKSVTDISPISGMTGLKKLNLLGCESVNGLSALADMKELESLTLSGVTISDSDVEVVLSLPNLKSVSVSNGYVSQDGINKLKEKLGDSLYVKDYTA